MFSWLFGKQITKERATEMAIAFMLRHGYRIIANADNASWADYGSVTLGDVSLPARRWYVRFDIVHPPAFIVDPSFVTVYVWVKSGLVTFDFAEYE